MCNSFTGSVLKLKISLKKSIFIAVSVASESVQLSLTYCSSEWVLKVEVLCITKLTFQTGGVLLPCMISASSHCMTIFWERQLWLICNANFIILVFVVLSVCTCSLHDNLGKCLRLHFSCVKKKKYKYVCWLLTCFV